MQINNKILIITYYWPPAGGPGVQRWLKFSKYLPNFRLETHIYTAKNAMYSIIDTSLEKDINPHLKIIKKPILEPYFLANIFNKNNKKHSAGFFEDGKKQSFKNKLSLFIRGNFFIPDARKFWISPSVKFLSKYLMENNITTVITTGPPHSMHLIGLKLKEKLNVKWIADFRDPWTNVYYYKHFYLTKYADKKHHTLEKNVLNIADAIITVNEEYQENYQKLTTKPVFCITNGYDTDNIPKTITLDSKFTLAYIGALFQERNPEILWDVLQQLSNESKEFSTHLSIKLIGKIDVNIIELIHAKGLTSNLDYRGYLPHKQAVIEQFNSQVLLLITGNEADKKGNIPGKLFEYLAAQRPIISFGPADGQIEKIITQAQAGKHFLFSDVAQLKTHIKHLFSLYLEHKLVVHAKGIEKYHRKNLTQKLVDIINKV